MDENSQSVSRNACSVCRCSFRKWQRERMFKYAAKPSAMTSEGMSSGKNIERRSYVKTDKIRSPTEIESVPTEHKRIHGGKK